MENVLLQLIVCYILASAYILAANFLSGNSPVLLFYW